MYIMGRETPHAILAASKKGREKKVDEEEKGLLPTGRNMNSRLAFFETRA